MSQSPGKLVVSEIAEMPGGNPAEAVLDAEGNVFARCRVGSDLRGQSWWSEWQLVSTGAVHVSLAPAAQPTRASGKVSCYLTVTSEGSPDGRTVYLLTSGGVAATGL